MASFSGPVDKSQYCAQGPPRGNINLVFSRQYLRRVENVFFSLVDPWQTYVPFNFHHFIHPRLTPFLVAGSGKSVLWFVIPHCCCLFELNYRSSGIIEDIIAQHEAGLATVAYFYCDFRDDDKQNCRDLLLSILSQLSAQSDHCCDLLARTYSAHDKGKRKPSDATLTKCLTEALSLTAQGSIYLILDALDECPNNSGLPTAREEVLDLVKELIGLRLPNLHICVTSRPEIDIQTALEPLTSLRVSLHTQSGQKKDIINYLTSVVSSDTKMRRWREEDRKLVIETLSERADGM